MIEKVGAKTVEPQKQNTDIVQADIKKLEQLKKNVSKEMARVKVDKLLSPEQKKVKIDSLQKQIQSIENEIKNLLSRKNKKIDSENKQRKDVTNISQAENRKGIQNIENFKKSNSKIFAYRRFDEYEKGEEFLKKKNDGTYRVEN